MKMSKRDGVKISRLNKGQLVSFKPQKLLIRRDATIENITMSPNKKNIDSIQISLYASPSELSVRRSIEHLV